jgi:membrane protein DedA with SNARE-associated domain
MQDIFSALGAWILNTVQTGGYVGVAFLTLIENIFPPIPSELILPVAGFLVSSGELNFVWVVVAATLGSVVGALMFYGLGAWVGDKRLRSLVRRYGKWMAMDEDDLDEAEEWFKNHGGKAVFIGRLVPSLRSLISVPAGVARMPLLKFTVYTTVGSGIWNAALVGAGWGLGHQWELVKPYLSAFGWASLVLVIIGTAWWFVGRKKQRGERRASTSGSTA